MYKLHDWIDESKLTQLGLSENPSAISYIDRWFLKIGWHTLCENPRAMELLETVKIEWYYLSGNPDAIDILQENPDKIAWQWMSINPAAIHLLEKNLDKVHWGMLSLNTAAVHILQENPDKIAWEYFSCNPSIFTYDYKNMVRPFTEELMQNRFHPSNLEKFELWGY